MVTETKFYEIDKLLTELDALIAAKDIEEQCNLYDIEYNKEEE